MNDTKVFENNLLKMEVKEINNSIYIYWYGKSTDRKPGTFLTPILLNVLKKSSEGPKQIIMNFCNLQYMNSSTITPIIKILERAKRSNIHLTVLYEKSLKWQELNFSALRIFQTKDQRIRIKGIE